MFRVLAIDGGGIRGIIPALVLADIERRTGRRIASMFDLIAGTSTGGILACALTIPEAPPAEELVEIYRTRGPAIFHRTLWHRATSVEGLIDAKHDEAGLEKVIDEYIGDIRLADATTRLLVTSYDLQGREPYFFKSWRVAGEPERDLPMRVAARATSAAPTYFEPLEVAVEGRPDPMALIDGGVFANNPAMCAYAEAKRLVPDQEISLLSLGTGEHTAPIPHSKSARWGLVEWARPLIDVVFDGVSDTVDYEVRQLLGDGYVRLQRKLDHASDALDDASASNLEALAEQAQAMIAEESAALDAVCAGLLAAERP